MNSEKGPNIETDFSPDLFKMYIELILRELELIPVFIIGGQNNDNITYVDVRNETKRRMKDLPKVRNLYCRQQNPATEGCKCELEIPMCRGNTEKCHSNANQSIKKE